MNVTYMLVVVCVVVAAVVLPAIMAHEHNLKATGKRTKSGLDKQLSKNGPRRRDD